MRCVNRVRRTLPLPWATRGASGPRRWHRAWVSAAVGVVALVVLAVGVAVGVIGPSWAGATGLRSNDFHPDQTSVSVGPCDRYGRYGFGDHDLKRPTWVQPWMNRWVDRAPIMRSDGREIVFADGDAMYAVSVQGTQLWRPVREDDAFYIGRGRGWSRYRLEGIVSFDVSRVDGALVYATCWAYRPDGNDPEIARCTGPGPIEQDCFKNPPRREVPMTYRGGSVQFDIGDDLYQITVVRPDEGTVADLYLGNFPTWSPDSRRIAFVSNYRPKRWGKRRDQPHVQIMAADGTAVRSIFLPAGKHADFPLRWSPDGTRLAFLVFEEGPGDSPLAIYTVGANGTGLQRLAAHARSDPAWSPDGTRLAFGQVNGDGDLHLHTMAADGTDVRQITAAPIGPFSESDYPWIRSLAWSPAGTRLLYRCVDTNCVVDLEGQLVGGGSYARGQLPAWSADGRRIVHYNPGHDRYDDVVLSSSAADGTDPRVLVRAGADGGLLADQAENFRFPGPVATRAACSAGVVVLAPAQYPGLVADCEVLVALRAELFGRAATNWTTNTPLAAWEGVVVGGTPARVRALVLGDGAIGRFDHGGRLPAGIAELAFLERLDLSKSGLAGSIPAAWGALARLRWLDLRGNKLTGTIPAELGQLGNLEVLRLAGNQLTGTIPAELGQLASLRSLWLAGNQLTGTIPAELGTLVQLQDLSLGGNSLSGTIPPALGQLWNLEVLGLGGNRLSGTIPVQLGQLRNLKGLWLDNNQLTGEIPAALGQLGNLERLHLFDNQLTGAIPAALGQLQNLERLGLENNQLTSTIPAALGQLGNLKRLLLGNNQLTGTIPAELAQLRNLRELRLHNNQLTGCIPVALKRALWPELKLPDCEAGA